MKQQESGSITIIQISVLMTIAMVLVLAYFMFNSKADSLVKRDGCLLSQMDDSQLLTPVADGANPCPEEN